MGRTLHTIYAEKHPIEWALDNTKKQANMFYLSMQSYMAEDEVRA